MKSENVSEHLSYLRHDLCVFWTKGMIKGQALFVLPITLVIAIGGSIALTCVHALGFCVISIIGYPAA